jgi:lipoprotein-anchoring transpeptidase ErfK/SrfK
MPDRRPPENRLNAAPRTKGAPSSPSKPPPKSPRKRRPRAAAKNSTLPYWIVGGLLLVLVALIAVYVEAAPIRGWLAKSNTEPLPEPPQPTTQETAPTPLPSVATKSPAQPKSITDAERLEKLKEKAERETRLLQQRTAIPPAGLPPLVQPVPLAIPRGAPARALPVDPNRLDTERIAAYQVALERIHFSCGFIDGDQGMRTQRMLRAFQASRGLAITGFLDAPTRAAIGEPGEPFLSYVVTHDDLASIMPKPTSWREKSKVKRLGYNDIWEMLAEKFHCTRAYLKGLNPGVRNLAAGTEIIGPKVFPAAPIPKAASLRILLSETSVEALNSAGKVIAFFPCSIAKDKNKRPSGALTVKSVVPDPDYTFDPALFADAAKEEGITHKMVLPPGPRNPVGTTWIGLSLPGYGIHGTPEPENISRTQSHGCFRLANWNAEKVLKMVHVGTPVDVEP